ncbi:Toxic anion resistance protein (TelA) [Bordetella ansorpii]|uniref:Toxic anion resistance protein (TelA) n=2 Tax=Bordetella ansorpii TaxID=288768 RepID=A0A157P286_9BORD|nr:Toxic anion resistance protein (TelA) [Bordetella ansorpii]
MEQQTQTLTPPDMVLTPPEVIQPVEQKKATDMVALPDETTAAIDKQVASVVNTLFTEDVHSDTFKSRVDALFHLGRNEISNASELMTGRFMERNFVGIEDSAAFKAIQSMRSQLDELNPGREGDLLSPRKLLGLIPFGNKLQDYFRKFQDAGDHLKAIMADLHRARDDMQRDSAEIDVTMAKLWDAMQKLKGAITFAEKLDTEVSSRVAALKTTDPDRARALEQEVLFYVRQNYQDMQTQMAVNVNGYLSMTVLKKTAREMVNGCNRVATTGMSALATAQTVARATGNQIQVMEMLQGVSNTIGDLVTETSRQLGQHVQRTGEFAADPLIGVQRIQEMMDNTFKAMDAMDTFRSQAIDTMGKNNALMKAQIERSEQYLDRSRQQAASEAVRQAPALPDGPVQV